MHEDGRAWAGHVYDTRGWAPTLLLVAGVTVVAGLAVAVGLSGGRAVVPSGPGPAAVRR